jgi:hypothetical protein
MRGRHGWTTAVAAVAVLALACGTEAPPKVVTDEVGGLVPVEETRAAVRRYAADAADAAGAKLVVVEERKTSCGGERVSYTLDVYAIEATYRIDVPAAGRQGAVAKIGDLWRARGYRLEREPAPNDIEAGDPGRAYLGIQPATGDAQLPLYVNSTCHTNPASPSASR